MRPLPMWLRLSAPAPMCSPSPPRLPRRLPPRMRSRTIPPLPLKGVRGKDVTKAAKALLKDTVKRGGGSIQMQNVIKIYPGSTVHALDDFNLDIKPGEMVVLLGGSGCGKSTALRSLAGLEDIQGGRIMVGGRDVTGVPVNKREDGHGVPGLLPLPSHDRSRKRGIRS